ncbi:type VI secretion system lipoprotein TssJ [Morganella psychrotolerans]|uniref:type VI secretion system lipoprotein TssJ n=1 Tax=Morganella psychrotolerans TaxID=368603 RepID=UPI0039B01877
MSRVISIILFFSVLTGLTACRSLTLPESGVLRVVVRTQENSNPNADNQPAPVVLRIYQLNSDEIFNRESFMALWQHDQSLLKEQLLAKRTTGPVYPASEETLLLPLQAGTTHIGVLAGFAKAGEAKNKIVAAVLPLPVMLMSLYLDGLTMSMTAGADADE